MKNVVMEIGALKSMIIAALVDEGASREHAAIIADSSCEADLRGVASHGAKMLPAYLERIKSGGISLAAEPHVHETAEGMYVIDGNGCFGQVAASRGAERIVEAVRQGRMGCAVVKNTNHCGMLAYYTEKIAAEFAVGFMACNTNPNVAAFGGAEKVLGTNPFSVAFPGEDGNVVLDMATTAAAKGKIYEYEKRGEAIPAGWAVGNDGTPTTDPGEALNGVLLAFGGHKGYAISLAVEILSGVLSGSGYSRHVFSLHNQPDRVQNVGFFMMGFPIRPFMDEAAYYKRLKDLSGILKNSRKQAGSGEILLPGEAENRKKTAALSKGIAVDEDILIKLGKGVL